ncbi:hypothetical protein Nmel_008416, partial [Mimus melanotis]
DAGTGGFRRRLRQGPGRPAQAEPAPGGAAAALRAGTLLHHSPGATGSPHRCRRRPSGRLHQLERLQPRGAAEPLGQRLPVRLRPAAAAGPGLRGGWSGKRPAAAGAVPGGAADGARGAAVGGRGGRQQRADAAVAVATGRGEPGAAEGRAQATAKPHRRLQVPPAEAGAHRPVGGKGEGTQGAERRAGRHSQPPPRPGHPAAGSRPQPPLLWLPHQRRRASSSSSSRRRPTAGDSPRGGRRRARDQRLLRRDTPPAPARSGAPRGQGDMSSCAGVLLGQYPLKSVRTN